ncbi:hypothetical protein ACE6H2_016217 [Prunus campanulata]
MILWVSRKLKWVESVKRGPVEAVEKTLLWEKTKLGVIIPKRSLMQLVDEDQKHSAAITRDRSQGKALSAHRSNVSYILIFFKWPFNFGSKILNQRYQSNLPSAEWSDFPAVDDAFFDGASLVPEESIFMGFPVGQPLNGLELSQKVAHVKSKK